MKKQNVRIYLIVSILSQHCCHVIATFLISIIVEAIFCVHVNVIGIRNVVVGVLFHIDSLLGDPLPHK